MNFTLPSGVLPSLALCALLVGGCYSSHRRPESIARDAGSIDATTDAARDAGPLPSCDELFRRTPDIVNEFPYVDFTCTETTFPLAMSYLELWAPGSERIVRACFVVTRAHAASGWTVGEMLSEDGPAVRIRVAGPSPDFASERVEWDVRGIDIAGRVVAARAESLRIGRATPTAYGAPVEALAWIVPSLWASPGQVNAGLYGHPARDGRTLRAATLGGTWLDGTSAGALLHWVYPDERVRTLALPGVPVDALVLEWLDGSDEQWRLLAGDRMTMVSARATADSVVVLGGTSVLPGITGAEAIAYDDADARVLVLQRGTVLAFGARDGRPLGMFATGVRALLPNAVLFDDGRLEPVGSGGEAVLFSVEDIDALGRVFVYLWDGLLVGQLGVAGTSELTGPHFVSYESVGIAPEIRSASGRSGQGADVLYRGRDTAHRAQRLAPSFRGCD